MSLAVHAHLVPRQHTEQLPTQFPDKLCITIGWQGWGCGVLRRIHVLRRNLLTVKYALWLMLLFVQVVVDSCSFISNKADKFGGAVSLLWLSRAAIRYQLLSRPRLHQFGCHDSF